MEKNLIRKIYISIVWAWAIAMIWCLALQKFWIAVSITSGMILGTAVVTSFDVIIRKIVKQGEKNTKNKFVAAALIKYPLIALYIYLMVKWNRTNIIAFCTGVLIVNLAIIAKAAGIYMMMKRNSIEAADREEK